MLSDDDIQYALEMTKILHEPDRRIDTFASTSFQFHLISELMDKVGEVKIREGKLEAQQPSILTPEHVAQIQFEGFGSEADEFGEWMERSFADLAFLKYGFQFKRTNVTENTVHEPIDEVCDRVVEKVVKEGNPMDAVILGVDEPWEICLLRFSIEMMQKSQGINVFDFKRKGLM